METPFLHSWFDLPPAVRSAEIMRCATDAATMGRRLNATVALSPPGSTVKGLLGGLPYVTKDMFDRSARRAQWGGCRAPGAADADADILHRLDSAGGREIAVTAMSALAYEPSGYNSALGRARNPWHPGIVTGGSSSGSAAMVAAGAAYLGVGSDTGGSIRVPAACCGLVGLKPGWGKLPLDGAMPLAPSLDVIGFLARRASDLIRVWAAVAGTQDDCGPIESLALIGSANDGAAPVVRAAIAAALETLAAAGITHEVIDCSQTMAAADAICLTIMQAEAARIHGGRNEEGGLRDSALARRIAKGRTISDRALAEALEARAPLRATFLDSLGTCDAAILPVMPMPTPLASQVDPDDADFQPRLLYAMTSLTRFVNALGLPAIAVPVGFDGRGAPLSMQVVGRPGSELALLRLAAAYQQLTCWHERRPPVCAAEPLKERCA